MDSGDFDQRFVALTGNKDGPFPWQRRLYELMCRGVEHVPESCNLPTGLGKTSVIAVWLLARQVNPELPRRLVYVVNRRTVVDQTTEEVEKYRKAFPDLALSTLRGQFADNRAWSADPSQPAVICGTVDMIGSRLLFGGYGLGFKQRPLHAGFLGQDALLVHDEAHLEPAFQDLLMSIKKEQARCGDAWPLRVMELTATSRGAGEKPFSLGEDDLANATVQARINAKKEIRLIPERDPKKLAEQVAELALAHSESGRAVLVFVRNVGDVMKVSEILRKQKQRVEVLTGTLRGKERDELAKSDAVFARFLPEVPAHAATGTVYLVCTSAGEVGVNISADHLVCDLSTFESMAQRFGRVNRFGKLDDTKIDVVHPTEFGEKDFLPAERERTLRLLEALEGDGSPLALGNLNAVERQAAFAPTPKILPATDILFDAWALTSIRDKLPGRPTVEPYLHGVADWEPPQTQVAWRAEVGEIIGDLLEQHKPEDLLDDYPLKPHELLREPSHRAFKQFEALAKRRGDSPAWLVDSYGKVEVVTVAHLADKDNKDRINKKIVILPPSAGGLRGGMLDGSAPGADELDVADIEEGPPSSFRERVMAAEEPATPEGMHRIRRIDLGEDDEGNAARSWYWFEAKNEGGRTAHRPVLWSVHVGDVEKRAGEILKPLGLPAELDKAVRVAASLHDHGKRRESFQRVLGNTDPDVMLAKSGGRGGRATEPYRHEFGSLTDARADPEFNALPADQQELVLHLIASHHGYARPHFPADRAFDPDHPDAAAQKLAAEVPARFARLQRRHGRWGLAYLESLLRAADWAASANPSKFVEG